MQKQLRVKSEILLLEVSKSRPILIKNNYRYSAKSDYYVSMFDSTLVLCHCLDQIHTERKIASLPAFIPFVYFKQNSRDGFK